MPGTGSYSGGSASADYIDNIAGLLSELPDNNAQLINAKNVRDSIWTLWNRIEDVGITASQIASQSTYYTNATPIPVTFGGLTAGTTFSNATTKLIFDELFYPWIGPTSSLSVSPVQKQFGQNNTVNLYYSVTPKTDLVVGISVDSQSIIPTGLYQTGMVTHTTANHPGSVGLTYGNTFTMSITYGTPVHTQYSYASLLWMHRMYWGVIDLSGAPTYNPDLTSDTSPLTKAAVAAKLTDAVIRGLTGGNSGSGSKLVDSINTRYLNIDGGGNYLAWAFPTLFGEPYFIVNGLVNTAFTKVRSNSTFTNEFGFTFSYDVWVTNTLQNAPLDIDLVPYGQEPITTIVGATGPQGPAGSGGTGSGGTGSGFIGQPTQIAYADSGNNLIGDYLFTRDSVTFETIISLTFAVGNTGATGQMGLMIPDTVFGTTAVSLVYGEGNLYTGVLVGDLRGLDPAIGYGVGSVLINPYQIQAIINSDNGSISQIIFANDSAFQSSGSSQSYTTIVVYFPTTETLSSKFYQDYETISLKVLDSNMGLTTSVKLTINSTQSFYSNDSGAILLEVDKKGNFGQYNSGSGLQLINKPVSGTTGTYSYTIDFAGAISGSYVNGIQLNGGQTFSTIAYSDTSTGELGYVIVNDTTVSMGFQYPQAPFSGITMNRGTKVINFQSFTTSHTNEFVRFSNPDEVLLSLFSDGEIKIKQGKNAPLGTASFDGITGVIDITNQLVTSDSYIVVLPSSSYTYYTYKGTGTFSIVSSSGMDNSTIQYLIINPI